MEPYKDDIKGMGEFYNDVGIVPTGPQEGHSGHQVVSRKFTQLFGHVGTEDIEVVGIPENGNVAPYHAATAVYISDKRLNAIVPESIVVGAESICSASPSYKDIDRADNFTIDWDFGDGTSATGKSVKHKYASTGNYVVSVVAYATPSNLAPDKFNPDYPPEDAELFGHYLLNVKPPSADKAPVKQVAPYTASLSTGASTTFTYKWFVNGTETSISGNSLKFSEPGDYNVELRGYMSGEEAFSTSTAYLISSKNLSIKKATPEKGRLPLAVEFEATLSTGKLAFYSWDFGDGYSADGRQVQHVYYEPGNYKVSV